MGRPPLRKGEFALRRPDLFSGSGRQESLLRMVRSNSRVDESRKTIRDRLSDKEAF
jgi:hypothetical protein